MNYFVFQQSFCKLSSWHELIVVVVLLFFSSVAEVYHLTRRIFTVQWSLIASRERTPFSSIDYLLRLGTKKGRNKILQRILTTLIMNLTIPNTKEAINLSLHVTKPWHYRNFFIHTSYIRYGSVTYYSHNGKFSAPVKYS